MQVIHLGRSAARASNPRLRRMLEPLVARIQRGEWQAGDKLPPIRELARRYGTSFRLATTVIEQLEARGLVERYHGSGTYVTAHAADAAPVAPAHDGAATSPFVPVFTGSRESQFWRLFSPMVELLQHHELAPVPIHESLSEADSAVPAHILEAWRTAPPRAVVLRAGSLPVAEQIRAACPPSTRLIAVYGNSLRIAAPWTYVGPDEQLGYGLAVRTLLERGHRRILLVTAQRRREPSVTFRRKNPHIDAAISACREAGRHEALMIHRVPWREEDPRHLGMDEANLDKLAYRLTGPDRPTAVICAVYRMGCVRVAAQASGLRFGEDLDIIGMGDPTPAEQGEYDCVDERYEQVARHVVRLAVAPVDLDDDAVLSIRVPPRLVPRRAGIAGSAKS